MIESFDSLRTWVEIDLDALEYNVKCVRALLPENKKLIAVIKANAYGHGAVKVAHFLKDKVDLFAVAATDEALELRKSGIDIPILILGHIPFADYPLIVKYKLIPAICDVNEAELLRQAAENAGTTADFHIAVDTGMSRIGFDVSDKSVEEIEAIAQTPNIKLRGIFSHFAMADSVDKSYTQKQMAEFDSFLNKLREKGIDTGLAHFYNSAAIADLGDKYDMVRQGIILYGLNPSDEVEYKNIPAPAPVMSMRTHIVQVKTLPANTSVSYGCTYKTKAPTVVATLCAGYADGVPRLLSNNGEVIVNGKKAPIIGRVCMDQFMVDVTDVADVKAGDTATIFGRDGEEYISVDSIAQKLSTINYEIVCGINSRVTRVYIKNGKISDSFCYLPYE